ncbi:MAG: glycosyltransferase family 39 protein [Candidatus Paceibacterota bacterium]
MSNRLTNILAVVFLSFVFIISIFSIKGDSLTMDEVAHLPAGYSYLTQQDMRLNPEHPPLIKDLAALPLLFIKNINFPSDIKAWQEDVNGQWDFGFNFLYQANNQADKMIFAGRVPMILLLVLLGFFMFKWSKELFGNKAAVLTLFLFSFSPTLLAHGRLVTTDVGAALGVLVATYYFLKALKNPTAKNIIISGIAFGLAELCKFSVILLLPFFFILALVFWLIKSTTWQKAAKVFILVILIGYILVWPVYQYHVLNYPAEKQRYDTEVVLKDLGVFEKPIMGIPAKITLWASDKPILRPYSYYAFGLLMATNRATSGNTTYFLGQVYNLGWHYYFPVVYILKESLAFHILTLLSLLYAVWLAWKSKSPKVSDWIKSHFSEFAMILFLGIYWLTSIISTLNIGVRHLLPVFPFTILLVSAVTSSWLKEPSLKLKYAFLAILLLWQAVSVISVYPSILSYFNETIGGPSNGYLYVVDSNLDWGQDLKRLTKWVEDNKIEKIYINYFGGGDPSYYLKEKYVPWSGTSPASEFQKGNYLAVSATLLQGGRGVPIKGFSQPVGHYLWLNNYQPIAIIGNSIFVYYIP